MRLVISKSARAFAIRTSATFFTSLGLLIAGCLLLVHVAGQERHDWRTAQCSVLRSVQSSITKSPCVAWLVTVHDKAAGAADVSQQQQQLPVFTGNGTAATLPDVSQAVCGMLVPHTVSRTMCAEERELQDALDAAFASTQSDNDRENRGDAQAAATALYRNFARPFPCRVPVDSEQWIRQDSGQCNSGAGVLWPRRIAYLAPLLADAEAAIDSALDEQKTAAVVLIIVGSIGSLVVVVALAYACYWQAMHTCADTMFGPNSARRRAQRRRWFRGGRGGDSASEGSDDNGDDDSDETRGFMGVYVEPFSPEHDEDAEGDAAGEGFGAPYRQRPRGRTGKHISERGVRNRNQKR